MLCLKGLGLGGQDGSDLININTQILYPKMLLVSTQRLQEHRGTELTHQVLDLRVRGAGLRRRLFLLTGFSVEQGREAEWGTRNREIKQSGSRTGMTLLHYAVKGGLQPASG